MSGDIDALIAGLTEAQRRVVLTRDALFAEHAKGKWHALHTNTATKLFALGLIETPETLAIPTPLGLQVRARLQEPKA